MRLSFSLWGLLSIMGTSALALNLDSEFSLKNEVEWRHVSGMGPILERCQYDKTKSLKCESDVPLAQVECTLIGNEVPLKLNVALKEKIFACESLHDGFTLNHNVEVIAIGRDGSRSEWSFTLSSAEQQKKALTYEMKALHQKSEGFRFDYARLSGGFNSGDSANTSVGLLLRAKKQQWVWGAGVDYAFGKTRNFDNWYAEAGRKVIERSWFDLEARLQAGRSSALSGGTPFRTWYYGPQLTALESVGFLGLIQNVSLAWPFEKGFKQKMEGSVGFRLGPVFSVAVDLVAGYKSEIWSSRGGGYWSNTGPFGRLDVSWFESML